MLGIDEGDINFDTDIIIHINSVLSILRQLGVGPSEGFYITGKDETWKELLLEDNTLEHIKSYVYLKVRLIFDPPTSSAVLDAMKQGVAEYEWRVCNN